MAQKYSMTATGATFLNILKGMTLLFGLLFCSLVAIYIWPYEGEPVPNPEVYLLNKTIGKEIITAIHLYQQDKGQLPGSLAVLVPDYLAYLPETTQEEAFRYKLEGEVDDIYYYLCFDISRRRGCCYTSRFELWDCSGGYE